MLNKHLELKNNFIYFKIIFDYNIFDAKQKNDWKNFLLDIWFNEDDFQIYKNIISWNAVSKSEINNFENKVNKIFMKNEFFTKESIYNNQYFLNFIKNIKNIQDNKAKVCEIIFQYIYSSFRAIIIDYEVKRISMWVFDIYNKD